MTEEESAEASHPTSRRRLVSLGLAILMIVAFSTPVSTAQAQAAQEPITISGNSVPSDCSDGRGAGAIFLSGDIEGCLTFFPTDFVCEELDGFDRYREEGKELFTGTLNGERGKFRTSYTLDATYAPGFCDAVNEGEFPFELQLTGGCDHKVRGRTGAFAGLKGLITFFDVIPDPGEGGATNFLYAGELKARR